jgi:type I restriction-modification system DNA methylase subunit
VSDGSLLFLLHLLSKMRPAQDGGSRFGIVLNGSPLFTGGAGSARLHGSAQAQLVRRESNTDFHDLSCRAALCV